MERGRRLELLLSAWKAEAQPLDQPREMVDTKRIELFTASVQTTLAPLVHACPLRWSEWQVSNLRPHAPKARALPTELHSVEPQVWIEQTTYRKTGM